MIAALLLFGLAAAVVPFVLDGPSGDEDDILDDDDLATGHHGDRPAWPDEAAMPDGPGDTEPRQDVDVTPKPEDVDAPDAARTVTLETWDAEIIVTDAADGSEATLSFRTDAGDRVTLVFPGLPEVPVDGIVVTGPSLDGATREEVPLSEILAAAQPVPDDCADDSDPLAALAPVDPDAPDVLPVPSGSEPALAPSDADAPDVPPAEPSEGEALRPISDDDGPRDGSCPETGSGPTPGDTATTMLPSDERQPAAGLRMSEGTGVQETVPAPLRPEAWPPTQATAGDGRHS